MSNPKKGKQMGLSFFGFGSKKPAKRPCDFMANKAAKRKAPNPTFGAAATKKPTFGNTQPKFGNNAVKTSAPKKETKPNCFGASAKPTFGNTQPKFGNNAVKTSAPKKDAAEVRPKRKRVSEKKSVDNDPDFDPKAEAEPTADDMDYTPETPVTMEDEKEDAVIEATSAPLAKRPKTEESADTSDVKTKITAEMSNFKNGAAGNKSTGTNVRLEDLGKKVGSKTNSQGVKHKNDVRGEDWYENPKDFAGIPWEDEGSNKSQWLIPEDYLKKRTPGHKVWWETKSKHADCILLYKIGKFYEIFWMDAHVAHELCGCSWMAHDAVPHVGFPENGFDKYLEMLVRDGYKVVRVEQMESPDQAKADGRKGVRRSVCQVVSPGTMTNPDMLEAGETPMLLCVTENEDIRRYGVAFVDSSTANFYVGTINDDRCRSKFKTLLAQIQPREVIWLENNISDTSWNVLKSEKRDHALFKKYTPGDWWDLPTIKPKVLEQGYFPECPTPKVLNDLLNNISNEQLVGLALGNLVNHLQRSLLDKELVSQGRFNVYDPRAAGQDYMVLDGPTLANLEIFQSEAGEEKGSLFNYMDKTSTSFGKRKLRQWISRPLCKLDAINVRLDAVQNLIELSELVQNTREKLKKLPDVPRLLSKVCINGTTTQLDKAVMFTNDLSVRKVTEYCQTLEALYKIQEIHQLWQASADDVNAKLLRDITLPGGRYPDFRKTLSGFGDQVDWMKAIAEKACTLMPRPGVNMEFENLKRKKEAIEQEETQYLTQIKRFFGDNTVKFKDQKQGRRYIEVKVKTSSQKKIPAGWVEDGSTKSVKRFLTTEQARRNQLYESVEKEIDDFKKGFASHQYNEFSKHRDTWDAVTSSLSELDCLMSVSLVSAYSSCDMARPTFLPEDAPPSLRFKDSRHPVAHASSYAGNDSDADFIPNDVFLGSVENPARFCMVTGPNMGGKSTLLRQVCICVIMAQMGCYVPSSFAELTVVDRIFTRIGANDRIMSGHSTFFVELDETSTILNHATEKSLVILDELGRGTSTFDGTGIAYAVANEISDNIKCRTLFSTHYHLLPNAFKDNPNICMFFMSFIMDEETKDVTFLYKFTKGVCSSSHGLNCAKMAGLSQAIIDRARKLSQAFERDMELRHNSETGDVLDGNSAKILAGDTIHDEVDAAELYKKLLAAIGSGDLSQVRQFHKSPELARYRLTSQQAG